MESAMPRGLQALWLQVLMRPPQCGCGPDAGPLDVAAYARLMRLAGGGDRAAFEVIVARHGPSLLRMAGRLLDDAATAEDVMQDALIRAWMQAARFDGGRARLRTWLYRIVINLCIDDRRRVRPAPWPDGHEPPDPSPSGRPDAAEAARGGARQALGALSAPHRAAVALVYEEGMSGAEAAEVLGLTAKAVERLLARARDSLRAQLAAERV